jgi:hypothetical protein
MITEDYRKLPCPTCGEVGFIIIDHASGQFKCKKCQESGFDPFKADKQKRRDAIEKPDKKQEKPNGAFPPIPTGVSPTDLVEEYAMIKEDGVEKRRQVRVVYCPRVKPEDEKAFSANDPWFQFVLHQGLRKKGENRRRYNRDIIKRHKLVRSE